MILFFSVKNYGGQCPPYKSSKIANCDPAGISSAARAVPGKLIAPKGL